MNQKGLLKRLNIFQKGLPRQKTLIANPFRDAQDQEIDIGLSQEIGIDLLQERDITKRLLMLIGRDLGQEIVVGEIQIPSIDERKIDTDQDQTREIDEGAQDHETISLLFLHCNAL